MKLRRLAVSDLREFQAYRNEELARYQGWTARSDAEATEFLARMSAAEFFQPGQWSQIGIQDAAGSLIGDIGLFVAADGRHAEIGITLRPESQGRGMASAAAREAIDLLFAKTDVTEVRGISDARNVASLRLLERLGMRRIESREADFRGEKCVEHVYAISRQ